MGTAPALAWGTVIIAPRFPSTFWWGPGHAYVTDDSKVCRGPDIPFERDGSEPNAILQEANQMTGCTGGEGGSRDEIGEEGNAWDHDCVENTKQCNSSDNKSGVRNVYYNKYYGNRFHGRFLSQFHFILCYDRSEIYILYGSQTVKVKPFIYLSCLCFFPVLRVTGSLMSLNHPSFHFFCYSFIIR